MRLLPLLVLAAGLSAVSTASAQDFLGGLARGAARSAAESLTNRAVQAVTQPRQPTAPAPAPARPAPQPAAAPGVAAPRASAPAPLNAPLPVPVNLSPSLRTPGEFEFSPADEAAKKAFEDFGKVPCNSCEGGYSFETWPQHQIPGMFGKVFGHLWGLSVGESLSWTGARGATYAITVKSEIAVNGFPCKQLGYVGRRGGQSASYDGLICSTENGGSTLF